ncbi:MAG: biopolymer transporter ExbD [Spirochaetales bacterium]|nr:biopolymer transporter ExbD [Spirochaetales bacterium]
MPARKHEWKKIKESDNEGSPLLITPLIDIMFLLLIFFVMNTSFNKLSPIEINLPESSAAASTIVETLTVSLSGNGIIKIGEEIVQVKDITSYLNKRLEIEEIESIIIAGDESVSYAFLVEVMDRISLSGISDITLLTENK